MRSKSEMKRLAHLDPSKIVQENLAMRAKLAVAVEGYERLLRMPDNDTHSGIKNFCAEYLRQIENISNVQRTPGSANVYNVDKLIEALRIGYLNAKGGCHCHETGEKSCGHCEATEDICAIFDGENNLLNIIQHHSQSTIAESFDYKSYLLGYLDCAEGRPKRGEGQRPGGEKADAVKKAIIDMDGKPTRNTENI